MPPSTSIDLQSRSPSVDGTRRVGASLPPGTYRQTTTTSGCYWARLSGFSGSIDDVIANQFTSARQIVTTSPGDVGFESSRCGTWSTLIYPMSRRPAASFGDGIYLSNLELLAGTWRNSDSSGGCYWERLSGFSGELEDIITNEFTFDQSIVTISSGDTGFSSEDCGTWTYLGP